MSRLPLSRLPLSRLPMRLLVAPWLLALGVVIGIATVALHHEWWTLALGATTTLVVLAALPAGWWSRLAYAAGWLLVVAVALTPRAEGDYLISGDARGYLLLGLAVVVLVTSLGTLPAPRRAGRGSSTAP